MMYLEPLKPLTCKDTKLLLLLLNQPFSYTILNRLWKNAVMKVCCDGAASQLYLATGQTTGGVPAEVDQDQYIPDIISGDFDSINKFARTFYKNKGTTLVELADQDKTDFTKSLEYAVEYASKHEVEYDAIIALGAFGGRLDQTMANINTLIMSVKLYDVPMYLYSDCDVACLLPEGRHEIDVHSPIKESWCSLIPVGHPVKSVTTSGLRYNVTNCELCFGSLVSTSNSCSDSNLVTVDTNGTLLWTIGYKIPGQLPPPMSLDYV